MSDADNVTVSRADFDALLRRANSHADPQKFVQPDYASVTIAKTEYDGLLRTSYQLDRLKTALFQGGVTSETIDLLIAGSGQTEAANEADVSTSANETQEYLHTPSNRPCNEFTGDERLQHRNQPRFQGHQRRTNARRVSPQYDDGYDGVDSFIDDAEQAEPEPSGAYGTPPRTLYFAGLPEGTTYKEVVSLVKGGKLLNVAMRSERSATVSFVDRAADFLAWAKRNDIYLRHKRIDVRWADRQFHLKGHIENKIANGATRNIVIHSAVERDFTEERIRDDMEHIHQLVIVDITFRNGAALVSMNSVHNALFARTCMLSRTTYKGCKIEFSRDECDTPLPVRTLTPKSSVRAPPPRKMPVANRFDMLNLDDGSEDGSEDDQPSSPKDGYTAGHYAYGKGKDNVGVSLRFVDDVESTA